jgi:hypothetical protein
MATTIFAYMAVEITWHFSCGHSFKQ